MFFQKYIFTAASEIHNSPLRYFNDGKRKDML